MGGAAPPPARLAREVGIHPIAVPTPFGVGPVNAYLLEDEPLTLVDSGPAWARSLRALELALGRLGHRVDELGLLLLTHHHHDHLGLTRYLAERSGAEVAALAGARAYVEDFDRQSRADSAYAAHLLRAHGADPGTVAVFAAGGAETAAWGSQAPLTVPLADGAALALRDRTLTVHHRPGHSPTDTVFADAASGVAFTGDHLIGHISANPLITRPLGAPLEYRGPPPRALLELRRSLRATAAAAPALALPGHGEPIAAVEALVERRLASHERRAEQILAALAARPLSAHRIALELWGERVFGELFLTLCEVLGHLDLLRERGLVTARADGAVTTFAAARG